MAKLTKAERRILGFLVNGGAKSHWALFSNQKTLEHMAVKNLVGVASFFTTRKPTWAITEAGRRALAEDGDG